MRGKYPLFITRDTPPGDAAGQQSAAPPGDRGYWPAQSARTSPPPLPAPCPLPPAPCLPGLPSKASSRGASLVTLILILILTLLVSDNKSGYFGVYHNKPGRPKPYQARVKRVVASK